jgi:hypothetical protein
MHFHRWPTQRSRRILALHRAIVTDSEVNVADRRAFDHHIKVTLRKELVRRYKRLEILSEADLQFVVCNSLRRFFRTASDPTLYQVANQRYLKDMRTFPDILVLRNGKPWACIELKEKAYFHAPWITADWNKLSDDQEQLGARRGYLIYLARKGVAKQFKKSIPKRKRGLGFVAIAMSAVLKPDDYAEWSKRYREQAKIVVKKPPENRSGSAKKKAAAAV